jgi:hypothetical protein
MLGLESAGSQKLSRRTSVRKLSQSVDHYQRFGPGWRFIESLVGALAPSILLIGQPGSLSERRQG